MPLFSGFLLGLGMIVFIGPVFIQLISISIRYGSKPGLYVAVGIFISDVICVLLSRFASSFVQVSGSFQMILSLLGAILLLILGLKTLMGKGQGFTERGNQYQGSLLGFFAKGFVVNFVNPFVFLVWIGVTVYSKTEYGSLTDESMYLSGVLLAILCMDVSKVFLAKQISKWFKSDSHLLIQRLSGMALLIFSIRLFINAFR